MSEEIIIQHLRDKELHLLNELNKVRMALQAFVEENINPNKIAVSRQVEMRDIPVSYNSELTYSQKVLHILSTNAEPMLVDEIVATIQQFEPLLDSEKTHKNVSYNLSMLVKYSRIKKYAFNRKVKYAI